MERPGYSGLIAMLQTPPENGPYSAKEIRGRGSGVSVNIETIITASIRPMLTLVTGQTEQPISKFPGKLKWPRTTASGFVLENWREPQACRCVTTGTDSLLVVKTLVN
jgi:hypothetical protein